MIQYFEYKARKYDNIIFSREVYHTLDECIDVLKTYIQICENTPRTYTISNINFDENPFIYNNCADEYFELPDWKKIEKWNSTVNPCDTVIHCGEFGNRWARKYLTGKIKIMDFYSSHELKI